MTNWIKVVAAGLLLITFFDSSRALSADESLLNSDTIQSSAFHPALAYGAVYPAEISLQKRSSRGEGKASSSRRRPSSYYEAPSEQDTPSSATIRSDDFLGFVDKAIETARRTGWDPTENPHLQKSPLKWLSRAQASVLRDPSLISEAVHHYASRMSNPNLRSQQRRRVEEKLDEWQRLSSLPKDEAMESLVYDVADSYRTDISRLREDIQYQREYPSNREEIRPLLRKKKEAEEALSLWSGNVDLNEARSMINKELKLYAESAEAAKHSRDPGFRADMIDHATKAIAWFTRV